MTDDSIAGVVMRENDISSPDVTGATSRNAWSSAQPLARTRERPPQRNISSHDTHHDHTHPSFFCFHFQANAWCYLPSYHSVLHKGQVFRRLQIRCGPRTKNESIMSRNGFAACPQVTRSAERTGLARQTIFFLSWALDVSGVSLT